MWARLSQVREVSGASVEEEGSDVMRLPARSRWASEVKPLNRASLGRVMRDLLGAMIAPEAGDEEAVRLQKEVERLAVACYESWSTRDGYATPSTADERKAGDDSGDEDPSTLLPGATPHVPSRAVAQASTQEVVAKEVVKR